MKFCFMPYLYRKFRAMFSVFRKWLKAAALWGFSRLYRIAPDKKSPDMAFPAFTRTFSLFNFELLILQQKEATDFSRCDYLFFLLSMFNPELPSDFNISSLYIKSIFIFVDCFMLFYNKGLHSQKGYFQQ